MSLWTVSVRRQLKALASGTGAAMKNVSQQQLRLLTLPWPNSTAAEGDCICFIKSQTALIRATQNRAEQAAKPHLSILNNVLNGNAA
jgi:hypothetical protein